MLKCYLFPAKVIVKGALLPPHFLSITERKLSFICSSSPGPEGNDDDDDVE